MSPLGVPSWVAALGSFFTWFRETLDRAFEVASSTLDAREDLRSEGFGTRAFLLVAFPLTWCWRVATSWRRGTWTQRIRVVFNTVTDMAAFAFTVVVLWPAALYAVALTFWWLGTGVGDVTNGGPLGWAPVTAFNAVATALAWIADYINLLNVDWPGVFKAFLQGGES